MVLAMPERASSSLPCRFLWPFKSHLTGKWLIYSREIHVFAQHAVAIVRAHGLHECMVLTFASPCSMLDTGDWNFTISAAVSQHMSFMNECVADALRRSRRLCVIKAS